MTAIRINNKNKFNEGIIWRQTMLGIFKNLTDIADK